jgi:hypothetical protein
MLPPEERLVGAQLQRYIRDQLYWVLHAPRQTGKTTFLKSWMQEINSGAFIGEDVVACYVNVKCSQGLSDPECAIPVICEAIANSALKSDLSGLRVAATSPCSMLYDTLENLAILASPKKLIMLFDEVDVLMGDALLSFLRQIRDGFYFQNDNLFPSSIALAGVRELKDYIIAAQGRIPVNSGSPFYIKQDSDFINNFSKTDIARLFAQRTEETGQDITPEALDYVYDQSRGQPWIVNSLFKRATMRVLDEDSRETVTIKHVMKAREQIIQARETHLDALAYRMENPLVRNLMETLLSGKTDFEILRSEAFRLCLDLGLVAVERGAPTVANPLYREGLARYMTDPIQFVMPEPEFRWENADGSLDMDALLKEFQKFWRENSETWEEHINYTEAFPHLLLMAFLQRVLNGGGRIDREYAAGRGRMDLFIEYKNQGYLIEIKLIHAKQSLETIRAKGIEQIANYRDAKESSAPSYLVIFDRRPEAKDKAWDERISWQKEGSITVLGC